MPEPPVPKPGLLVLASTYPRWKGDAEPGFVHELTRRLSVAFDVTVVTPHARGALREEMLDAVRVWRYRYAPAGLETLVHAGGIVTNLRRSPWKALLLPGFLLGQWLMVRRAMKSRRPRIVHAHWLLPQGLIARLAAQGRVPYVVTSHGADLFALRGRLFASLRRWAVRRAAAVTVVSQALRRRLLDESPTADVRVLPMGVDAARRFIPDAAVARTDDELLFVGRLVEKKGLHHLIEAMPWIVAAQPRATLVVAGFGPERPRLERRVGELALAGHVRFLGAMEQAQLPGLYRRAALFVAPFVEARGGDQEGLGLVVAEAMACGCPVLVGAVAGVRDLVDDDTGVRVQAADHAALAAAVVDLLRDRGRRAALAEAGRARVLQHYAWEAVADKYARLFDALLKASPQ